MNTLEGAEQPQKWQQRRFVPGPEQQNQRELSLLIDKEYLFKYGGNPVGHNPSAQLIQDAPLQTQKSPQSLYSGQPQQSTAAPIKQAQQPQSSQGQKRHWPHLGRRVPVQLQMSQVECGAACVAMMLSYHGRQCSIAEINEQAGIGRDGLSALDITRMARKYGLRVRAITTEDADLRGVTLPAIVHWQFNHFLIVERWTTHYVDVVDPARGRRRISSREFDQSFTGVVIMLEPGEHFERRRHHSNITIASYARQYIQRAPWIFVQIILASLLIQVLGLAIPLLTASVIDKVIPQKSYSLLPILGLGMAVVIIAQLVTTQLRALLLIYLQIRIDRHMLPAFMEHLLSLPQSFFLKRTSGDIMTRINSNTTIRDIVSSQLVSTILDGGTVLIYLVILLTRGTGFGMIVLGIGSMQIVLLLLSSRKLRMLSRRELEATGKTQGYVGEILKGMEALKVGGAEQRVLDRWSNVFSEQLNASVQRNYVASTVKTLMGTLQMLSTMLLLWYGTGQVMQGHLLLGTMLSLNILASAFLTPLASLVSSSQQLQIVRSHLERIADVLEARPEQDVQQVHQPPRLKGSIRLDNVSFRYDTNSPMILKHISLEIEPGQKIAIVGRTGSGKSTLGKLLLGLIQATKGEISYDGIPLRYLNYQAVRAQFGVVMQDVGIFSGSIRQNIAFNAPDIPVETIVNVARLAELNNDIAHMPMGYETFVSEGGNALSGGQRQRLAIARALAHRPALLLMDEATSALDVLTEHRIEENLRRLPCTQILIAHRLSTIRNADHILVLDDGVLVEQGTHAELLRRNSFYAHLIQYQLASGEVRRQ